MKPLKKKISISQTLNKINMIRIKKKYGKFIMVMIINLGSINFP